VTSLEELFCSVDDFCQVFEPVWERQLLGNSLQLRKRTLSLSLSESITIQIAYSNCLSSVLVPEFQDLLYREGASTLATAISWPSQLQPLCGTCSKYPYSALCLFAFLLWPLYWP
jgi:hypothetical protein